MPLSYNLDPALRGAAMNRRPFGGQSCAFVSANIREHSRMLKSLLIANRGEIAVASSVPPEARRAARSRSIQTPTRRRSLCVWRTRRCTSGRRRHAKAILVGEKIIEAAKATGAEAIHPGYGFLSRTPTCARR
jgi:acetyl/propionyl-CoA carboxylase alpha subunit